STLAGCSKSNDLPTAQLSATGLVLLLKAIPNVRDSTSPRSLPLHSVLPRYASLLLLQLEKATKCAPLTSLLPSLMGNSKRRSICANPRAITLVVLTWSFGSVNRSMASSRLPGSGIRNSGVSLKALATRGFALTAPSTSTPKVTSRSLCQYSLTTLLLSRKVILPWPWLHSG
ncbi:hypothetical protein AGABI1DRAFT_135220, partial [Agaricus bisporus var. burnettii JB137-S8]